MKRYLMCLNHSTRKHPIVLTGVYSVRFNRRYTRVACLIVVLKIPSQKRKFSIDFFWNVYHTGGQLLGIKTGMCYADIGLQRLYTAFLYSP